MKSSFGIAALSLLIGSGIGTSVNGPAQAEETTRVSTALKETHSKFALTRKQVQSERQANASQPKDFMFWVAQDLEVRKEKWAHKELQVCRAPRESKVSMENQQT